MVPCSRPLHSLLDGVPLAVIHLVVSARFQSALDIQEPALESTDQRSDGIMADICEACFALCACGCECVGGVLDCLARTGSECLRCAVHCSNCVDCCVCLYSLPGDLGRCCSNCDCTCLRGRGNRNRSRGAAYRRQPSRTAVSVPPPVAVPVVYLTAKVQPEGPMSPPSDRWGQLTSTRPDARLL